MKTPLPEGETPASLEFRGPTAPGAFRLVWLLNLLLLGSFHSSAAPVIIDDFAYPSSPVARQAWVATSAPAVAMATGGDWGTEQAMTLTCDFVTRSPRCYWDRAVALNLSSYTDFALEVYASDPGAISLFTIYFKSGTGWYGASTSLAQTGWQTLRFSKAAFIPEGTPSGWGQITGIRLSPWKAAARNTDLAVRELRAFTPPVLLLRDDLSSNSGMVQETIDRHVAWLGGYNIDCGVLSRAEVEAGLLAQSRLAILPYNENISAAEWTALETYVAAGGKLLVYYLLPSRMEPLLGMRATGWSQGDFATWMFADPSIPGLPGRVAQASWNITYAVPDGTLNSRVSATWANSQGASVNQAAWLASDHGYFMSHVLLGDDSGTKSYALLCLVAHLVPDVWPAAASGAIDRIGHVAEYWTYDGAAADIRRRAEPTLRAPLVDTELAAAAADRDRALAARLAADYPQAVLAAQSSRDHLKQAYFLALKPTTPEFRAIWEHHATGPFPGDWPTAIDALATNGFNAVFPNMLWGGLAHYNSAFLPHSSDFTTYGDQITACVNAAHARGVQVHVWKVNWNLNGAPQPFIDALRAANRTQVSRDGQPLDWLCPSHPENLALETNSMLEVVQNYPVDGIHFDYIRYPDSDHCYCAGCGARFQSQTGRTITNWPADVLASGTLRIAFLDWRRAQINRLVTAVHDGVKAAKPGVKVSAAVFPDATSAFDGVGQDWRKWIADGLLDFVCPMDYTASLSEITNLVAQQLGYAAGRVPVYPGIGAFILEPDGCLAQIEATRHANTGGFIVFELSPASAKDLLPVISAGATAPDEPDFDQDLLPDAWEIRWFGNLTTAGINTDTDGDGETDRQDYILGRNPTQPSPDLNLQAHLVGGTVEVSFLAQAVSGPGYQNAERRYRLETTRSTGTGEPWESVPGFTDRVIASGSETLALRVPSVQTETSRFYRVRVWLQQKPR